MKLSGQVAARASKKRVLLLHGDAFNEDVSSFCCTAETLHTSTTFEGQRVTLAFPRCKLLAHTHNKGTSITGSQGKRTLNNVKISLVTLVDKSNVNSYIDTKYFTEYFKYLSQTEYFKCSFYI
jgi:UDP-2,3-diacylglucosamine pyrophosphatase LpxH